MRIKKTDHSGGKETYLRRRVKLTFFNKYVLLIFSMTT